MNMKISRLWSQLAIEDEVSLVQQLYDTYWGEENGISEIVVINSSKVESYVSKDPSICGVRKEETISRNKATFPAVDGSKYLYFDKVLNTNIYKIEIDWGKLKFFAGQLHDKEADQPYGLSRQKQILKKLLNNVDAQSETRKLTISEEILGKYFDHATLAQQVRGDDSPDRHINFHETLTALEKEGFLKIHDIEYDFRALPKPDKKWFDGEGLAIDQDIEFYPAAHCTVVLELIESKSQEAIIKKQAFEQALRPSSYTPRSILPVVPALDELINSFDPQIYPFVLMVVNRIIELCSFSSDGKISYQLQSPSGQQIINERSLISKFNINGLFSYYGEDEIFGIVTLGNINLQALKNIKGRLSVPDTIRIADSEDNLDWKVTREIWSVYESSSRADSIFVPVARVIKKGQAEERVDAVFKKLAGNNCFSKLSRSDRYYIVEKIDHKAFPEIYERIRLESVKQEDENITTVNNSETWYEYEITFTNAREIKLGDKLIGKPNFLSENDLVWDHLYRNPNKKTTKTQLEEEVVKAKIKGLHKIVENLGFKGDMKKVFFNVSRDVIEFKNPVKTTIRLL